MYSVTKTASNADAFRRPTFFFESARAALRAYMQTLGIGKGSKVLLPAYIGWSSREGSGVYDPIHELEATPVFYRVSDRLEVDAQHVMAQIISHKPQLLILIHYFGFPDPNAALLADFAHKHGIPVLEDEAHAMLSDVVGGICGRWGDAAIYSLHKLLPFPDGGALVLNGQQHHDVSAHIQGLTSSRHIDFWEYDLYSIAEKRRRNAQAILAYLEQGGIAVTPLHASIPDGVVPQTLPILLHQPVRDEIYFRLNALGLGVVSLYHTLIDAIDPGVFPSSAFLARQILNLPVHQDTNPAMLQTLVERLKDVLALVSKEQNASPSPAVV